MIIPACCLGFYLRKFHKVIFFLKLVLVKDKSKSYCPSKFPACSERTSGTVRKQMEVPTWLSVRD
jgi:hypothetical protein